MPNHLQIAFLKPLPQSAWICLLGQFLSVEVHHFRKATVYSLSANSAPTNGQQFFEVPAIRGKRSWPLCIIWKHSLIPLSSGLCCQTCMSVLESFLLPAWSSLPFHMHLLNKPVTLSILSWYLIIEDSYWCKFYGHRWVSWIILAYLLRSKVV